VTASDFNREGRPMLDQKFDYESVSLRNGDFLVAYLKMTFAAAGAKPDPDAARGLHEKLMQSLNDQALLLGEVKRLYDVLEGLKRRHMPLAGEAGAPVLCTGCSLHGGRVPWPCETYKGADSALPEHRP
jgi:hypothetical protein